MISITLDERGCGQGKTTDGIYKRIYKNHTNNIKTLVVVPNCKLQEQYKSDLDIPVHIINSDNKNGDNTTVKATRNLMEKGTNLIIITHQNFVRLPMWSYRKNYDLIIDEAIEDIIRTTTVDEQEDVKWKPNYDFNNIFDFADSYAEESIELSPNDDDFWYQLKQKYEPSSGMLLSSEIFKRLTDTNYIHYVTSKSWRVLNKQDTGRINVISVLSPNVLKLYKSVHIAASNFKKTKMYYWMRSNKIVAQTQNSFKKHNSKIKFWASDLNNFRWSNNKRKTLPIILDRYHDFVNKNSNGTIICVRNNNEIRKLKNEINVGHNVHGLNDPSYQLCTDVSLESALLFDSRTEKFIIDHWLTHLSRSEVKRAMIHMQSAYLFYQVIMRTKLRSQTYDNELINVFVLDQDTAVCLMDYFDLDQMSSEEFAIITKEELTEYNIGNKGGRPPLTEEQRDTNRKITQAKWREKQKEKRKN
jgi:hypothetical protein